MDKTQTEERDITRRLVAAGTYAGTTSQARMGRRGSPQSRGRMSAPGKVGASAGGSLHLYAFSQSLLLEGRRRRQAKRKKKNKKKRKKAHTLRDQYWAQRLPLQCVGAG